MTTLAVGMALGAGLLHAAWNVRLKSAADPLRLAALAVPLGTVAVTPIVAVVWLRSGTPSLPRPAVALAGVAGLLELAYFHSLSRAYRRGDISAVYPVARGTAPVLAALVGLFILRERLTTVQAVGVVVLVVGIWLARPPLHSRSALMPALLTGVFIAAYTTVDRLGVRMAPFWLYAYAHFVATSITLVPWMRRGVLSQVVPVGALSVTAYGLALAALSLAPLALVAPLRESGVVLVAVWGVIRMGERERASLKLAGAAVVLAGALLVAG